MEPEEYVMAVLGKDFLNNDVKDAQRSEETRKN